uniref:Uncharacterized protein n=1 Tax=Vitis vinifera TaxID=29760 RepID=F6GTK6_VITVI
MDFKQLWSTAKHTFLLCNVSHTIGVFGEEKHKSWPLVEKIDGAWSK